MSEIIDFYDGRVKTAWEYILKWVKEDPYIQRTDAIILDFTDGDRSDVEPPANTDRISIRITTAQRGWEIADTCKDVETVLVFILEIMVPSYYCGDGLSLWELLVYAFWSATSEPISKCSRYGIGNVVGVAPAIGCIPGNVARGEIAISVRYPLERPPIGQGV